MRAEKRCLIVKAAVCWVKFSRMMMVSPSLENFGKKVLGENVEK